MKVFGLGLGLALAAGAALAEAPKAETAALGGAQVSIYPWEFLTEEELTTLRLVLVNEDALAIFVPADGKGGFAALAVSPDDGFIREGALAKSATALAGLESADAAKAAALEACNAAKKGEAACEIVLDVSPE